MMHRMLAIWPRHCFLRVRIFAEHEDRAVRAVNAKFQTKSPRFLPGDWRPINWEELVRTNM